MISAVLMALASLSGPASAAPAAHPSDTGRHIKGQLSIPAAGKNAQRKRVAATCNPDPGKGRACRHHQVQAEQAREGAALLAVD